MTISHRGVTSITAVTRTVPDLDAAARFYQACFALDSLGPITELPDADKSLIESGAGRVLRLDGSLGQQRITLLQFAPGGEPYPIGSTASDLWFQHCAIVVSDMNAAYDRVMGSGARPVTQGGPQHLPASTGGVSAFKFRDPFGHPWELLAFPPGVGNPVWHQPGPVLFRGIDHTAIAVSESERSRGFYVDVLGLSVAEQTHNHGIAQTRLDAIASDDVEVVALNPRLAPPHLELLAYRTGTRRPAAAATPADAIVTRTLALGDVDRIAERLPPNAQLRRGTWDGRPAIAFVDPDRHAWICSSA